MPQVTFDRRRTVSPGVSLLAILAALVAVSAGAQSITGTVTDAQRGNGIGSMVVAAYGPDPTCSTTRTVCWKNVSNVTTDVSGRYTLNVSTGSFRVLAYDPAGLYATEFNGDAESFDVTPPTTVSGAQPAIVNFALRTGATISGNAVTSGGAKAGMVVAAYNLSGTRRGYATTAADGTFSIVVPPGSYKLVAYDETGTFATSFFRDRSDFSTADTVTVSAGATFSGAEFSLPIGARFSGLVTDGSGAPLSGIAVTAYNTAGAQVATSDTAANGGFTMTLPGGTYRFTASDESRVYATAFLGDAIAFDASQAVVLNGGQARSDLRFTMQIAGRLTGIVTDARTGAPLAGMTVAAYNAGGSLRSSVTSGVSGNYELLLPPGGYAVAAWDPNLLFATQFYALRTAYRFASPINAVASSVVELQPFALQHAGRFSGIVSAPSGAPAPAITVTAYDSEGFAAASVVTDSKGQFRMAVNAGSYRVIAYDAQLRYAVSYGGSSSFDTTPLRSITADSEQTLAFTLALGTHVAGRVVTSGDDPASGVEVTAYDLQGDRIASASTLADGSFQLALAAGPYKFGARDPSGRFTPAFLGGTSLSSATVVTVTATGAPAVGIKMGLPSRRRSVRR